MFYGALFVNEAVPAVKGTWSKKTVVPTGLVVRLAVGGVNPVTGYTFEPWTRRTSATLKVGTAEFRYWPNERYV
jgi:hypothetical protein